MTLFEAFPHIEAEGFEQTSPPTMEYNCIAWAADEDFRWWWPDGNSYWPENIDITVTPKAFIAAYATLGYQECDDGLIESGFEKVAIYCNQSGTPTHASKQLPDGRWTSKLGEAMDITHTTLKALEYGEYGYALVFLKRLRASL